MPNGIAISPASIPPGIKPPAHFERPAANRRPLEVNRSELRWADGVHLDERSAIIVTQAMERALASARAMK
jgi:hypothetical protein